MAFIKKTAAQKEFLPIGTKIANLAYELHHIGAHQAARHVQEAANIFHEDVERILSMRNNPTLSNETMEE